MRRHSGTPRFRRHLLSATFRMTLPVAGVLHLSFPHFAELGGSYVGDRFSVNALLAKGSMVNPVIEATCAKFVIDRLGDNAPHLDGGVLDLGRPYPAAHLPASTPFGVLTVITPECLLRWPCRIDFSRAEATLMSSSGKATSMSFLGDLIGVIELCSRPAAVDSGSIPASWWWDCW